MVKSSRGEVKPKFMRNYTFFLISLLTLGLWAQQPKDSVLALLNKTIAQSPEYIQQKERKIAALKLQLRKASTQEAHYRLNKALYEEYYKFKADSAVAYLIRNRQIAQQLGDTARQDEVHILLSRLYSMKGMYVESLELLKNTKKQRLSREALCDYYDSYYAFYSHYGQSANNTHYFTISNYYRDSLLTYLDSQSLPYKIDSSIKAFYDGKSEAEQRFLSLLKETPDSDPKRAIIAYFLGLINKNKGNVDLQEYYFAVSAIADIRNTNKDNASLQSLALTYYEKGDIDKAYRFIQMAIDDAVFCNVRHRAEEGASFYTIINAAYQQKEMHQKRVLQGYLLLISVLSLALIVALLFVFKQVKRLTKARRELSYSNEQLAVLNSELSQMNHDLQEANLIKEEYIAHFFNLCSAYIDKIENYRKLLCKKAAKKQYEDITKLLKSNTIVEEELEALYKNFDTIFLNIYPHFVERFNALLLDEEQIHPKKGELLNTELRIFALIRLGITDSNKIAEFLRYSLRTVYNYRTKVRNKAKGERDAFEEEVKKIRA